MTIVLDSWAVLLLLEGSEPAASRVQQALDQGSPVMSWINLGEVYYILRRDRGESEAYEAVRDLQALLRLDLPSEERVMEAARVKADHPLSYADAFAAATAMAFDGTLLTGDPELLIEPAPWDHEDLRSASAH